MKEGRAEGGVRRAFEAEGKGGAGGRGAAALPRRWIGADMRSSREVARGRGRRRRKRGVA